MRTMNWLAAVGASFLFAANAGANQPPDCMDLLRMILDRQVPFADLDDDLVDDRIDGIVADRTGAHHQALDGEIADAHDDLDADVTDAYGDQGGLPEADDDFFDRNHDRYLLYWLLCQDPEPAEGPGFDRPLGEPENAGDPVAEPTPSEAGLPPLEGEDSAVEDLFLLQQWRKEQRAKERKKQERLDRLRQRVPKQFRAGGSPVDEAGGTAIPKLPHTMPKTTPKVSPPAKKY